MIGLINAIDRFDPTRGIRFATYATPTVIGEIKRHFRDRGWAIKVPRRLQEINLEATKAVDRLSQQLSRSPTVEEIASEIGHSEDETLEAIEMGRYYDLVSLDAVLGNDDDGSQMPLGEHIGVEDRGLARFELRKRLEEALEQLGARERAIVRFRFFNGLSQTETARRLGISQMHVSRLQHRAMSRLREILREGD
jgi:RNA polymerase sigma-B factor